MTRDTQPMQADGSGTEPRMRSSSGGETTPHRPEGQEGESQGGAYPNPHTGKGDSPDGPDKFLGTGGQSEQAYYGPEQLGDDKLGDDPPNAPSRQG